MRLIKLLKRLASKEKFSQGQSSDGGLPLNLEHWPEDWLYRFKERAATIELSQGLTQAEAVKLAEKDIRNLHQMERAQQEGSKN